MYTDLVLTIAYSLCDSDAVAWTDLTIPQQERYAMRAYLLAHRLCEMTGADPLER